MPESTRYKDLFVFLKSKGFSVYSPAQKQGECISPYLVIKDAGVVQFGDFSSVQCLYDIMCYVPKERFTQLEEYVHSVEESMKELYPVFRSAHYRTASFYDDTVKAHMVSTQYVNYKKFHNYKEE